jgi:hypothetical protein
MRCSESHALIRKLVAAIGVVLTVLQAKKTWIAVAWQAVTPLNGFNLTGARSNNDYKDHSIRRWIPR